MGERVICVVSASRRYALPSLGTTPASPRSRRVDDVCVCVCYVYVSCMKFAASVPEGGFTSSFFL